MFDDELSLEEYLKNISSSILFLIGFGYSPNKYIGHVTAYVEIPIVSKLYTSWTWNRTKL